MEFSIKVVSDPAGRPPTPLFHASGMSPSGLVWAGKAEKWDKEERDR